MSQVPIIATILLVEPDDAVRPILKDNLRRWGYRVIMAFDEADALQRISNGGESFDLILINQFKQSLDQTLEMGRRFRSSLDSSNSIFIVIMAERYGVELEGQDQQVSDREYVTYLEDGQQLKNLLYRLCPDHLN